VDHQRHHGAGAWPGLEAVPKKPKFTCFVVVVVCNTPICLQLAMHRASSCGTHRVVTHSRKMRFSAHRTSCPTLHKQQRRSLRRESTTTQPSSADAGLCVATAMSFRPLQQQSTFCSVSLLTRAVVAQQSHNKPGNWHADSSRRSVVQRSRERTAPRISS